MIAKLDNFSEITKLLNAKRRIGDDNFSLFGKFRLSQTLSRLGMEKQCGYSASELIQALCMFKVLGETISSMWYHKFYDLLQVGKNCFYRNKYQQREPHDLLYNSLNSPILFLFLFRY